MIRRWADDTFAALRVPNYRRYFAGQAVSLVGTWMQTVAQGWLVLELTGSGTALGPDGRRAVPAHPAAGALRRRARRPPGQAAPADRDPGRPRRDRAGPRACSSSPALVQLWMVLVLALMLGAADGDRQPGPPGVRPGDGRRPARLRNAVSLNSVLVNTARAVGPAMAGILIATTGTGICFLINAASYAAVVVRPRRAWTPAALHPTDSAGRAPGQVRQGLTYVAHTTELLVPLMMLALVGTLAYEFQVVLPLLARGPLEGGAGHLRPADLGDGRGRDRRRPGRGRARAHRAAAAHRGRGALRRRHPRHGRRALGGRRPRRPHGGRRDQRHLPRRRQHHAPAHVGPALPRAGDGALDRGLPRQHAPRRPDHRLGVRADQPARGAGRGRARLPRGRRRRRDRAGARARRRRPPQAA